MPQLENEDGFVALGCELVKYDSQFEGVINSLLGSNVQGDLYVCLSDMQKTAQKA